MSSNRNNDNQQFSPNKIISVAWDSYLDILANIPDDKKLKNAINVQFKTHIQKLNQFSQIMLRAENAALLNKYHLILSNTGKLAELLLIKLDEIKKTEKEKEVINAAKKDIGEMLSAIGKAHLDLLDRQQYIQHLDNLNPTPSNPSTSPQQENITIGGSRVKQPVAKTANLQKTPLETNSIFRRPTSAKPLSEHEHEVLMKIKNIVASQFWKGKAYNKEGKDVTNKRPLGISQMAKKLENYSDKNSNAAEMLEEIRKIADARLFIASGKPNSFKKSRDDEVDQFYRAVLGTGTQLDAKNAKIDTFVSENKEKLNLKQNKVEQKSPMRPGKK